MKFLLSALTVTLFLLCADFTPTVAQDRSQQLWQDNAPAQPMNNPGPPQLPGAPTQTPIGSGLALLLAAGGAYAVKKLRDK
ncbi:hypothetical protein CYPRO_0552 [Cyclonatronum proteinivorum]|uniref:Uncharacterized protein n=1 Tax=Cyclonatronum proteinivorum TaxID=1457365 RepID=A0A345UH85_9BACT|nr:hypothetical protein [Cyclonatronum proteinivorum]AXI99836.1 hypothetical protein CYPRO_0552 [Cyclonatronum proteinivorum]